MVHEMIRLWWRSMLGCSETLLTDWSINFNDHWKRSYRERGREERSYDLHKVVSVASAIWTQWGAHYLRHGRKRQRAWCFIRYDPHLQTVTVGTLTLLSYKQTIGTVYIIIPNHIIGHQEIVETLVFPVRSDHVMDPWDLMFNTYKALASIIRPASGLQGIV